MKSINRKRRIFSICSISIVLALGLTACSTSQKNIVSKSNGTSGQQQTVEQSNSSNLKDSKEVNTETKSVNAQNANVPKFVKQQLANGTKPSFNTEWKSSVSGNYSACIEGKGSDALEEGAGKIFVKDKSGSTYSFEISSDKKISPRNIEWIDDENLLVVVGASYGTVSKGGNLYLLNINTSKTSLVFETPDKKQQIMTTQRTGSNISLKVNVYEDDNYTKAHVEDWTIYSFDKSLQNKMEVKSSDGKLICTINGNN